MNTDQHFEPSETQARRAVLPRLQVLSAAGADAIDFLHGQLTQDIRGLPADTASPAGYCTAKGRLLATMVVWRPRIDGQGDTDAPHVLALVPADVSASLVKRLRMFVLRAKVTLSTLPLQVSGVWTSGDAAAVERAAGGTLARTAWQSVDLPSGTWIAAPSAGPQRWWWIASDIQAQAMEPALQTSLQPDDPQAWHADDLAAGIAWIGASTQDLFIPQTVNLDLTGGISFTKGCYPGQEVVARSHYRGAVKRRMAYGTLDGAAAQATPGTDVYDAAQPQEPCGRVVDAVTGIPGAVLFETTLAALSRGRLHIGSPEGPPVRTQPLPYRLNPDEKAG